MLRSITIFYHKTKLTLQTQYFWINIFSIFDGCKIYCMIVEYLLISKYIKTLCLISYLSRLSWNGGNIGCQYYFLKKLLKFFLGKVVLFVKIPNKKYY